LKFVKFDFKIAAMIYSDKNLSQKLERTEARSNANFVEARAAMFPESGAQWTEIGGAYAMFDGVESPLTQTFGLGIFDEITGTEIERLEAFFKKHDAPVFHEVSPLAGAAMVELLNERGYQPIESTSVMYRPLESETAATGAAADKNARHRKRRRKALGEDFGERLGDRSRRTRRLYVSVRSNQRGDGGRISLSRRTRRRAGLRRNAFYLRRCGAVGGREHRA
jgi:hypothetical protein